jgi:hypothetical protein
MFLADLDREASQTAHAAAEQSQRDSWRYCWNWSGPKVGEPCSIDSCVVEQEDGTPIYAYMERCMMIEQRPDGRWLAEIAMGEVHGKPWPKDGTRVVLSVCDIWPSIADLRKSASENVAAAS